MSADNELEIKLCLPHGNGNINSEEEEEASADGHNGCSGDHEGDVVADDGHAETTAYGECDYSLHLIFGS